MNIHAPIPRLSTLRDMANALRALTMDAVEQAKSGHPGMPMGMADVAAVLFGCFLKYDPADPAWPDRDRFILSAGHGSMLLYAALHLIGSPDLSLNELKRFRQLGSKTPGHPEYGHTPGVETTTGPLGQGIATAVGMALAERMLAARYGADLVDHHTYVMAGDGCLMEGLSQEAIALAGHLRLGKLIVLWDDNGITIDGRVSLADSTDQVMRFEASGWRVSRIDGHDHEAIEAAIEAAQISDRPVLIACRTVIGFGAPTKAGTRGAHGAPLGAEEIAGARKILGWMSPAFEIPSTIASAWAEVGARGAAQRGAWIARHREAGPRAQAFDKDLSGRLAPNLGAVFEAFKMAARENGKPEATRVSSQKLLDVTAEDFSGRYIHYGIREHGMAAAMNGLALHGGFIPYGGTFLVFSDYSRPAIRLSALMRQRVIYIFTHDSIGLGEDGPTHQPVEHLAALRALPNLLVFRPADAVETAEAWDLALRADSSPSALCLSRQNLPLLRRKPSSENLTENGAYVLKEPAGQRDATLIATGSELILAVEAAGRLAAEGLKVAVVSAPCFAFFARQPAAWRDAVLGAAPRVGIEAALRQGWDLLLRPEDRFIGMTGFGASAPAADLYAAFGITVDAIMAEVRALAASGGAPA
jgi:transketolase